MPDKKRTAPDWDDLRFFLAVARQGSLSAAARRLGVNHATVSRRLAALEAAFGGELFARRPEGYLLNATGAAVLERAEAMESALFSAMSLFDRAEDMSGTVRITAPRALSEHFLVSRLKPFSDAWPLVDIEMTASDAALSLPRREADIAVRLNRPREKDATLARRIGRMQWRLVASPDYLPGRAPSRWRFVGHQSDDAIPEARWLETFRAGRPFAFRADSLVAQRDAARMGCGVAILPGYLVAGTGLVTVPGPEPLWREIWLLIRSDLGKVPRVRLMADHIAEVFRAERGLLEGRTD